MASSATQVQTNAFNSVASTTKKTNDMGKDEFLQLLVTQLKYQDPMSPMNNESFVAQLAQFSSLESMQNMQQSLEGGQAYSLIGKTVVTTDPDTGIQSTGVIGGVKFLSGKYTLLMPSGDYTADKAKTIKAFSDSSLNYDSFKDILFTSASQSTDTLQFNSSISSLDAYASALGYSSSDEMPTALSSLWGTVSSKEISLANIDVVY
ncbi:MAG: flagellar hook capping FlgD N-terminal domain-containing protein [Candidatus Margulisbacteria bacterium]|nr:flagellar hook capping FlgD N-terminal domain-containing protein [Candidatus Margulisiibacteriota bacterium]